VVAVDARMASPDCRAWVEETTWGNNLALCAQGHPNMTNLLDGKCGDGYAYRTAR